MTPIPQPSRRLVFLDALRGFDMFWIMGADAIGGALGQLRGGILAKLASRQLDHVPWQGYHAYDLIFPLFVFMAGVAIPLSLQKYLDSGDTRAALGRVLRRTVLLYVLGLLYYGGLTKSFDDLRLMGVLQRIALCYGAAGVLFLYLRPKGLVATLIGLLVGYWLLLRFVPVPGFGPGDFAEGHNLTNWIDAHYLPWRKWDGDHDPEGLLSTLPAVGTCLLGVLSGIYLRTTQRKGSALSLRLVATGLVLLGLGLLWGLEFPIIKKIWTSTFVLVAGGWSLILLGTFHQLIDVLGWKKWAEPFVWIGANPLALYIASNLVDFGALSARFTGGPVAAGLNALWPGLGAITLALTGAVLCFLLARFLYRKSVFIRL